MKIRVGAAQLLNAQEFTDCGYECAAWWQKVSCLPQTVDLLLTDEIATHTLRYIFQGTVTDADFTSHFAGVPFGHYDKERDVGKSATFYCAPYAYAVLDAAFTGKYPFDPNIRLYINPAKAAVIAHEFDHHLIQQGIKTHYHLIAIERLSSILAQWRNIPEYINVREVPLPACLLAPTPSSPGPT